MKTVKLPYICSEDTRQILNSIQKQSTSMIKLAYNRFWDNLTEKDIRSLSKIYKNINLLNSWLIQCSIKKAKALYEKDKIINRKTIFGGKFNFTQRSLNKIDKATFKNKILLPICSQGEKLHKGNRMFDFHLGENKIIFKVNKKYHLILSFPKLRKNLLAEFNKLQQLIDLKEITVSIELTKDFIYLTYDEKLLNNKNNYNKCKDIVASIDMNPEYIGFSISHFKNDNQVILHKEVIGFTYFVNKLGKSSDSKQSKKQVRKHKHEIIEVCKYLINKCKRFHVSKFVIEDLSFKGNSNSHEVNRKNKNKWNRILIEQYIKKYCSLNDIKVIEINPCYTSFIGNLTFNEPDMVAASLEITRRGFYKFQKGKFYPNLIKNEDLGNRWKEALSWTYDSWVKLFKKIKIAKLKYRNSLKDFSFKVFRLSSNKSYINLYSFI